jgi:hypothetical protein
MSSEIITFPGRASKLNRSVRVDDEEDEAPYQRRQSPYREGALHTVTYRSYDLIVQSDESDLVRDVCFDVDKAARKLEAIRQQLRRDRERLTSRVELLTAAETKLTAAIVVALLSTREEQSDGS